MDKIIFTVATNEAQGNKLVQHGHKLLKRGNKLVQRGHNLRKTGNKLVQGGRNLLKSGTMLLQFTKMTELISDQI